jgi:hypothetical protein
MSARAEGMPKKREFSLPFSAKSKLRQSGLRCARYCEEGSLLRAILLKEVIL